MADALLAAAMGLGGETAIIARDDLTLSVDATVSILKIRAMPEALDRMTDVFRAVCPAERRWVSHGLLVCAWLAPAQWLLTGPPAEIAVVARRCETLGGDAMLAVDLSHGRTLLSLSGHGAQDALAAHCPIDLRSPKFPAGSVARSLLGEAGLFLARLPDVSDAPVFRLIVDQTMTDYVVRMLAGCDKRGS